MNVKQMKSKLFAVTCLAFLLCLLMSQTINIPKMKGWGKIFNDDVLSSMSLLEIQTSINSGNLRLESAVHLMAEARGLVFQLENYIRSNEKGTSIHPTSNSSAEFSRVHLFPNNRTDNGHSTAGKPTNVSNNIPAAEKLSKIKVTLPSTSDKTIQNILLSYDKKFDNRLMTKRNPEGIRYGGPRSRFRGEVGANDVMCRFKKANVVKTLGRDTSPFAEIDIAKHFPETTFDEKYNFSRCAVVGSSFFLNESGYGEEIDNHDAVLRFNDAPTVGFEKHVGNKTTIRVVNSQAFEKMCVGNSSCPAETLVIWRTGPYSGNLYRWYSNSKGQSLFYKYVTWRTAFPDQDVYLVHPQTLWLEWDTLVYFSPIRIQPVGPSSGFTGTLLMLNICDTVDVYGYVLEDAPNYNCHYYDPIKLCRAAPWHPTAYEKGLLKTANIGSANDLKAGRVTLKGYNHVNC